MYFAAQASPVFLLTAFLTMANPPLWYQKKKKIRRERIVDAKASQIGQKKLSENIVHVHVIVFFDAFLLGNA